MGASMKLWDVCRELSEPFVVITLISGRGHVPQDLGAKAVVVKSGLHFGTVGGGKVEAKAVRHAQARLASGAREPDLLTWNLTRDVGMTCGGEMSLLFETHGDPSWRIAVFGAGHVAQALVPLLASLECQVHCADPREEWIAKLPEHSRITKHCLPDPKELVKVMGGDAFFACVSQGHAHDVPVLEEIFRANPDAPFVGVIGSATKGAAIRRDLKALGVSDAFIEKVRCPIGLKLGTNHPGEIAVSIAAQLLQVRDELQSRKSRKE